MISPPSGHDRIGVACLSICPVQKRLVVGTMRGLVYGIQLVDYNKIGEKVEFTHDFHQGFPVTCFLWDKLGLKLYSACNGGMVVQTALRAGMSALFGSADTELLLTEQTGIVQLDLTKYGRADILLVSSQLRVLLLNLSSTDGGVVQIGTKARQGNFGACFFTTKSDDQEHTRSNTSAKVLSARPGRRVWIADPQTGTVSATLKFSVTTGHTTFLGYPDSVADESIQARDLSINKLALFQFIQEPYLPESRPERSLLLSWNAGSSVLFFLDPNAVEIVEWHLDLGIIHDLKILHEHLAIVLHGEPPKVSVIQSCSARQFLDIHAGDDVKKAVMIAIDYQMNDPLVIETLRRQWGSFAASTSSHEDIEKITMLLDDLHKRVKELKDRYQASESVPPSPSPMQVIFKQRPQAQQQTQGAHTPDLFATNSRQRDTNTSTTPSNVRSSVSEKPIDYDDARTSSLTSYSRSIFAPDGSTLEARLIEIKELAHHEPVVRDDLRAAFMEDILDAVRKFESTKPDDSSLNLLPTIRGTLNNTGAAAMAVATYIPGANMLSTLMDTASHHGPHGGSSVSIFELPEADAIKLDPLPPRARRKRTTTREYAVLRIAMSATEEAGARDALDSEVLLEAISMDIWDSKLKYESNLPLEKQLDLPEAEVEESTTISSTPKAEPIPSNDSERRPALRRSKSEENLRIETTPPSDQSSLQSSSTSRRNHALLRRNSLSPDAGRASQRALQKFIGGAPSCEFKRRCMVSGQLANSNELEPLLKREVGDLLSELNSAAATAEQSAHLARRLWPAAGITRVCACLTNMYVLAGDFVEARRTIKAWLSCFDPKAKAEETLSRNSSPTAAKQKELASKAKSGLQRSGFARGEALVDGDGLPLSRSDWTLVRVMVSLYFAICAAGHRLFVRPALEADFESDGLGPRPYAFEMGIVLEVSSTDSLPFDADVSWTGREAEGFVTKYGIYLNTELAAEVCNKCKMGGALNAVLDQVVSSSNMSSVCDDIVNWIAEKQFAKALETLSEMNSICLILHVLDLLLKKCPHDAIELCVSRYPTLTPWNVERCLFGERPETITIEELLKPENLPQTSAYFRYLVRLVDSHRESVGKNKKLIDQCLRLCFAGSKVVGKVFDHNDQGSLAKWICGLLRDSGTIDYEQETAWELCKKNHVHSGLLELLSRSLTESGDQQVIKNRLLQLLSIIIEDKNLSLVEDLIHRLSELPNAQESVNVVLAHIERGAEKGDDELITTVIHALLNSFGTTQGMGMLARFPLLFAASPLSLYQTIVEAHALTQRQTHEAEQMLETVDTFIWAAYKQVSTSSSASFTPQVQTILNMERSTMKAPLDESRYGRWESKRNAYESELRKYSGGSSSLSSCAYSLDDAVVTGVSSRPFEYRSSDWGGEVQLHDATCSVCDLPVILIADDSNNLDVSLLSCGHAFHAACLQDTACPTCFDLNYESLLA
ncbi:hypothetical protein PINS_up000662 [Pythium insidiosum]|nr:hypothetical protein PINS_up000662 [Pythium insidiosum]